MYSLQRKRVKSAIFQGINEAFQKNCAVLSHRGKPLLHRFRENAEKKTKNTQHLSETRKSDVKIKKFVA